MASAKSQAIKSLGSENDYINLTGLNNERQVANDVFNTNRTSFQNAYNDLLNTVAANRAKANVDFTSGRNTVGSNAYFANRDNLATLYSRGVDKGVSQLGKIGNRMVTGNQYSDLANTYYKNLDEIAATEKTGTDQYNTNMQTAQNSLNAALADIDAREKAARNAYKTAVAQLAEQIQARRDANWNAQQQLKATKEANNNAYKLEFDSKLVNLYNTKGYDAALAEYNRVNKDGKLNSTLGTNLNAANYLASLNINKPSTTTKTSSTKTWSDLSTGQKIGLITAGVLSPTVTSSALLVNALKSKK